MSEIIGYEFKHSIYVESLANTTDDAVIIKERIHYADGTTKPNLRVKRNPQVPYYVVRESQRTFKQKRAWIRKDTCREYTSNKRMLAENAAKTLKQSLNGGMKVLNRNPYLAGTDISPNVLIKHEYKQRWGELASYYTTCHLDIETDMINKGKKIIMVSVSMGGKVFQAICRDFVKGIEDPIGKIRALLRGEIIPRLRESEIHRLKKLKQAFDKVDIVIDDEIILVDTPAQAVRETFVRVHTWKPDILSVWNLPFDLGHMVKALESEGFDPAETFCDPDLPRDLKKFKFREGAAKILDANGKAASKDPWDRWHDVQAPSSFFWVDQMSARRFIRKHLPKESSYGLGDVMKKEIKHGKLPIDASITLTGPNWHREMQLNHRIGYCAYNQFDNLGAQKLDETTLDLCFTFPAQCGYSELSSYGSQGRKLADDLYFFLKDEGFILCGVSDKMETEMDKYSVSLEGWISTLSAHLVHHEMGKRILKESKGVFTKIVKLVLDIDVKSSYPSTGVWANLARDTIFRVMCSMVGVDFEQQRRAGLNIPSGRVNAIDIGVTICNMPRPVEAMRMFEKYLEKKAA